MFLLLILSRSDIKKPSRRKGSRLTKVTQITTMILCLKSQLSGLLPSSSLSVPVRKIHSIKLAHALEMSPKLCLPGNIQTQECFHSVALAWPPVSLLSPLPQQPNREPKKLLNALSPRWVASGLGALAYTVSSPQTLLCHLTQFYLPVPPLAWR